MSFLLTKPAECRAPETLVLPDSRKRLTRFYLVAHTGVLPPELDIPWGTIDDGEAPTGWTGLRLTNRQMSDDVPPPGKQSRPILQLIYEQIDQSAETEVGGVNITHLEDGRVARVENWIQFSTGAYVPQTVGTTTSSGDSSAYLQKEEAPDDGTLRRITRTYVYAGTIATDEQIKNNGALSIKTITSVKTVPATPSGYILIGKPTQNPLGLPVYTYTFAKGVGEVEHTTEYRLSNDAGATGVTLVTIKYLSDSSVSTTPITTPSGFVTISDSHEDEAGYRVWTGQFANGTGVIDSTVEKRNKGKLIIYSISSINAAPSAPSATIGGTVVLIRSEEKREIRMEGVVVYDYQWAEGVGIIKDSIETRNDGLREETYVSLGTKSTPTGVVIFDDSEESEGVTRYTVKAMQNASGGDPTSGSFSFERYVPFTYPGRLKAFSETNSGQTFLDVFKSPPVQTEVLATVNISYQASGTLGSLPSTRWQPLEGATIKAQWVGSGNEATNLVESWRDYRSVNETPLSITGSGVAPNDSIFGKVIFGGTVARITVTGGPPDPAATWTLDAHLDYAFTSTGGTRYYRKTTVEATIAAQDALPV